MATSKCCRSCIKSRFRRKYEQNTKFGHAYDVKFWFNTSNCLKVEFHYHKKRGFEIFQANSLLLQLKTPIPPPENEESKFV